MDFAWKIFELESRVEVRVRVPSIVDVRDLDAATKAAEAASLFSSEVRGEEEPEFCFASFVKTVPTGGSSGEASITDLEVTSGSLLEALDLREISLEGV